MTDPEQIKNALTEEEWRSGYYDGRAGMVAERVSSGRPLDTLTLRVIVCGEDHFPSQRERHALAALCLYQQPFGFDYSDLEWVLTQCNNREDVRVRGEEIASKIRALLPPRA